ncbi:Arc family DNA-binding protein [Cytobacillus sp. Hm23]
MTKRKNFPLRINPKLYDCLEKWAEDELRSVNAQIEILLKDAVKKAGRWKDDENNNS